MDDVDYEAWSAYLLALMRGAGLTGSLRIVDVACGTGNITVRLAGQGHSVTGIDNSVEMLSIAKSKVQKLGLNVPLVHQDMRRFELHKPVDVVVCACDGVNYLLTGEDVRAFFESANAALRTHGLLLFDISSRHKIESRLAGRTMGVDNEDEALIWQNDYDAASRVVQMQLTIFVRSGKQFERVRETHRQKAHESGELRVWLEETDFEVLGEYGDFGKRARRAQRIQFVARKN